MDLSKINKSIWSWRPNNWETLIAQTVAMLVAVLVFGWTTPIVFILGGIFFVIALPLNVFLLGQSKSDAGNDD